LFAGGAGLREDFQTCGYCYTWIRA
jgi:hypothetical protein